MTALNVAVIGAGPAGIYASDILSKSGLDVNIDLFERLPAPYGLVRYGVAPDHPRIKQIIVALYKILQRGDIRLIGNVEVGRDVSVAELHEHYDAIIFSTGADTDAPLNIPGADAPECYGGADFVSWYDGHPDHPRTWPLEAKEVAVLGVGNVGLDISRVLAKHAEDLMVTEIPENVAEILKTNPCTDVHVFGRRGPAQVKFTPLELRELGKQRDVDVLVDEADFEYDAMIALLSSRDIPFTTWEGWELLDAYERQLGEDFGELPNGKTRERVKVVNRHAMADISRGKQAPQDLIGQPDTDRVPERVAHRLPAQD